MGDLMHLCLSCFKEKGNYEVCPYCGYVIETKVTQSGYLQPGMILAGRYIIGLVVGVGGFGITYKAYDAKLDMVVAIKEFYPSGIVSRRPADTHVEIFTSSQEDTYHNMLGRFLEEAKNMAKFSGESDIVKVIDYFEENSTAYIVMEYIEGMLLKTYLKEYGVIPQESAVPIFLSVLKTVEKLHAKGIIHKDLSPDNLFVLEDNQTKLFDFGAANFQDRNDEEYHEVIIKAGFAPPEQYRKDNTPASTLDIYAAGALLYEMITGQCPLEATDRILNDELIRPSEMGVQIDENLERAILKAMALDPAQRFQSAKEFYDTVAESRRVELPVEKKGKRKYLIIQGVMLGILSVVAVVAGTLFYRYKIDLRNYVPDEDTSLKVWLVQDTAAEQEEIARNIKSGFEERYPEAEVQITFVPVDEYEQKLINSSLEERPDVYCTDYKGTSSIIENADLTPIVKHLDSVMYLFEEQYEESYPKKDQIPTGFQIAMYYRNLSKTDKTETVPNSIQLEQVNIAVEDESCQWILPKNTNKKKKKVLQTMVKKETDLNAVVGSLTCWSEVQKYTVSGKRSCELGIIPILEDKELLCTFQNVYAVKKNENKNQEKTAMLFLYYMLGTTVQREIGLKQNDVLPVNAKAYREYMDNLTQYGLTYIEDNIKVEVGKEGDYSVSELVKLSVGSGDVYDTYGKKVEE